MMFRPTTKPGTVRPRSTTVVLAPRAQSVAAVSRIQTSIPGTEADFHTDSYPRTIVTTNRRGLLNTSTLRRNGSVASHARKLLQQQDIVDAFDLSGVKLQLDKVVKQTDGSFRVDYKQVISFKPNPEAYTYRVRGGNLHVHMSKHGRIDQITSSVRHSVLPEGMPEIISADQAIANARAQHGGNAEVKKVELTFSLHDNQFNPVYDVVLDSSNPKKVSAYIVDATSGAVVFEESKLHFFRKPQPRAVGDVKANVLLCVPDPSKPISKQVHEQILKWVNPKNPTVLGNDRYRVVIGADDREVKANADGSFIFPADSSEARAVSNFYAVMYLTELYESVGAKVAAQYLLSIDNPEVVDNAYCDYINRTLKIGVGSGVENGGLAVDESNDVGIVEHEAGHKVAGDEATGGDLGGSQGAAINEGTCGDCTYLVVNFLMRSRFGKELGHELTREDIKNDPLVVGGYVVPKTGIRNQKGNQQAGKDEVGEEHEDGLICGAATASILVGLATDEKTTIEKGLVLYAQIYIEALHRLPASNSVTFKDLLRAFISADQQFTKGANRKLIEKSFASHNIKL